MHTRQKHYLTFHPHWTVILYRACTCDQTIAFNAAAAVQTLGNAWEKTRCVDVKIVQKHFLKRRCEFGVSVMSSVRLCFSWFHRDSQPVELLFCFGFPRLGQLPSLSSRLGLIFQGWLNSSDWESRCPPPWTWVWHCVTHRRQLYIQKLFKNNNL